MRDGNPGGMARRRLGGDFIRNQYFVVKQLSNTPEAVAFITGLRGDALRERLSSIFGRPGQAPARACRLISAPRCARTLLQQMAR